MGQVHIEKLFRKAGDKAQVDQVGTEGIVARIQEDRGVSELTYISSLELAQSFLQKHPEYRMASHRDIANIIEKDPIAGEEIVRTSYNTIVFEGWGYIDNEQTLSYITTHNLKPERIPAKEIGNAFESTKELFPSAQFIAAPENLQKILLLEGIDSVAYSVAKNQSRSKPVLDYETPTALHVSTKFFREQEQKSQIRMPREEYIKRQDHELIFGAKAEHGVEIYFNKLNQAKDTLRKNQWPEIIYRPTSHHLTKLNEMGEQLNKAGSKLFFRPLLIAGENVTGPDVYVTQKDHMPGNEAFLFVKKDAFYLPQEGNT